VFDVTVECSVRDDNGRLIADLTGRLGLADIVSVRTHLLKCLAEQPDALLVDLSGLAVEDALALPVFVSIVRQAARWPGTPVLFCAASTSTAVYLQAAAYRRLTRFPTLDAARRYLAHGGHALPSISEDLLPIAGSPRHGRNLVTEACLRWDVMELVPPASLICSELIANVVDHAGTMMTLRLSLADKFFFIAVRDGSAVLPVAPEMPSTSARGRGLHIVNATCHSWGSLPAQGGKVVWASLAR
jgi:hypothetical protein